MTNKESLAALQLRNFTESSGLSVRAGSSERELSAVERKLGVSLPPSLRELLKVFGGTDADDVFKSNPNRHIRFWSDDELRVSESDDTGTWGRAVVFADYLLNSVEFAVVLSSGAIITVNGSASSRVAGDIEEFIRGYIADDPRVFGA